MKAIAHSKVVLLALALCLALAAFGLPHAAAAEPNAVQRQQPIPCDQRHPMNDAWWTGPMLANTPATAPRGHSLAETYLYDNTTQGAYTANGARHSAPHANSYGSLTYLIYGLNDKTGFGLIPTAGYNTATGEPSSAGPGIGDLTMLLQRRLTTFQACRFIPIVSVAVEQTLPIGQYDRLGARPTNGFGGGAYVTNPEFLSQMYFWLPNRRIVRTRLDLSDAFSHSVTVQDASVYGTSTGFRGTAHPGSSFLLDNSWEYSLTRSWVLATDITYRNNANTRVTGSYAQGPPVTLNSGSSDVWALAPAVEYSWKPWIGVLVGVRLYPAGRNTSDTLTPAIALNIVH
ncbi:MAG: hypothetical protein WCC27_15140 [Acidobacteriaceae bacterium]